MFIDLHSHSISSDDSRATVEQFVKWVGVLRKKGFSIDGFVLTEHRKFDADKDYSDLAEQYSVKIFKGSELDTAHGHFLVYGVSESLTKAIDFSNVKMDSRELMDAAEFHGAIAFPAHPGRFGIGLVEYMAAGEKFPQVKIVEKLNGGGRAGENERAIELCDQMLYLGTGGSDAHLASHLGACMTKFDQENIANEMDLVKALNSGKFHPVRIEETN
ncbi:MAG: PHP-associated domain-containing protein [Dehalococcoidia bacterium]